jgi:hypothetical protein
VSDGILSCDTLEVVLKRLGESHDVSAYEAVDRLVRAGQTAGFDIRTLLRMIDNGIALQELLDLIVSRAVPISDIAPLVSKRQSDAAPPERPLSHLVAA